MSETNTEDVRVECQATRDPAIRLFIAAALFLGFAAWCFYEGHILDKYEYKPYAEDINKFSTWALNYYGPFIFAPPGLVLALWGMLYLRRRLIAEVKQLDATQLKSKGILTLVHENGELKLDSWKLTNFKPLVAFVEMHVPDEKKKA